MGQDLTRFSADKIVSQLGISHVPEGRRLFGNLTVLENLKLAAYARKDNTRIERDFERVFSIFSRLEERMHQNAATLSGGEQQMLAVGRALVSAHKMMLLDEPSMGLAPLFRMALRFAGRGYVLETGIVTLSGTGKELLGNPRVKEAYLGG
jgi:branched-chain amino acid transport system ATP-binding protein